MAPVQKGMNVLRRYRMTNAKAKDHTGEAVLVENPNFDMDKTIFRTIESAVTRKAIAARLRLEPFWCDEVVLEVMTVPLPGAPNHDQGLLEFMAKDCDFKMEHADGSFMDHLQFCYEYSNEHYKGESPRVLLLHSILGVGSNYFPCTKDKIPKLQSLLTEKEFLHVQAFPTVLRLVLQGDFMTHLESLSTESLNGISGLEMHRVIDNETITLPSKDDVWIQLNYQLVHLLDFLPALDWQKAVHADNFLANFIRLFNFLKNANQLRANVDLDFATVNIQKTPHGNNVIATPSLGGLIKNYLPSSIQLKLAAKQVATFSKDIGHSLNYTLLFQDDPSPPEFKDASTA